MKRLIACIAMALSLSAIGCGKEVPDAPEHDKCTYSIKFSKWRCCNSETKKCENRALNDPRMENAQAVSLDDFNELEDWTDTVIQIAKQRCK